MQNANDATIATFPEDFLWGGATAANHGTRAARAHRSPT